MRQVLQRNPSTGAVRHMALLRQWSMSFAKRRSHPLRFLSSRVQDFVRYF
jgi:hypothetical protein